MMSLYALIFLVGGYILGIIKDEERKRKKKKLFYFFFSIKSNQLNANIEYNLEVDAL